MTQEERSRKTVSFIVSAICHILLLLILFLFKVGLPNPPLPSGGTGMLVNLGYVDEGSGDFHTLESVTPSQEPIESQNQPGNTEPTPSAQQLETETNEQAVLTSEEESTIQVESKKPEKETKEKLENNSNIEPLKSDNKPTTENEKKLQKDKINQKALFEENNKTNSKEQGQSNGNDIGKIGDKGKPGGSIDERSIFDGNLGQGGSGSGGAGGGANLEMAGWMWTKVPKVKDDDDNENGRIVFEITIDENGDVISVKTIQTTVSPSTEKLYKAAVEKLEFIKTDGKVANATSTGRITFKIQSK